MRFTEEQMVGILREADASSVGEVAKKHKASETSIYAWRRKAEEPRGPFSSAGATVTSRTRRASNRGCSLPLKSETASPMSGGSKCVTAEP